MKCKTGCALMLYLLSASAAAEAAHACASARAPSRPLRHDMVLDVSVVDRTGKSVVMTISRRLTMSLVAHLKNLGENAALAEAATCPSCGAAAVPCRPGTSSSNTHDHACVCYACWRKLHATGSNCVVCGEAFSGLELPGGRFEVCPQLMDLTTGTALGDTTNAGAAAETTTTAPATAATKKKAVGMCKCCEKFEIQTPAQGPFATHNAATCPLNPDVGVPKAPGPKKRRTDPSAIPYEVGSCTRASNTDKTRGPLFRPGEDAVARRA